MLLCAIEKTLLCHVGSKKKTAKIIFHFVTLFVLQVFHSGAHQVVLRGAARSLSGRYRCEVSADAPFFHTVYKSSYMRVVGKNFVQSKLSAFLSSASKITH